MSNEKSSVRSTHSSQTNKDDDRKEENCSSSSCVLPQHEASIVEKSHPSLEKVASNVQTAKQQEQIKNVIGV
jgi:hypothetical protein